MPRKESSDESCLHEVSDFSSASPDSPRSATSILFNFESSPTDPNGYWRATDEFPQSLNPSDQPARVMSSVNGDEEISFDKYKCKHIDTEKGADGLYYINSSPSTVAARFSFAHETTDEFRAYVKTMLPRQLIRDRYDEVQPVGDLEAQHLARLQSKLWCELPRGQAATQVFSNWKASAMELGAAKTISGIGKYLSEADRVFVYHKRTSSFCHNPQCNNLHEVLSLSHKPAAVRIEPLIDVRTLISARYIGLSKGRLMVFKRKDKMFSKQGIKCRDLIKKDGALTFCVTCMKYLWEFRFTAWAYIDGRIPGINPMPAFDLVNPRPVFKEEIGNNSDEESETDKEDDNEHDGINSEFEDPTAFFLDFDGAKLLDKEDQVQFQDITQLDGADPVIGSYCDKVTHTMGTKRKADFANDDLRIVYDSSNNSDTIIMLSSSPNGSTAENTPSQAALGTMPSSVVTDDDFETMPSSPPEQRSRKKLCIDITPPNHANPGTQSFTPVNSSSPTLLALESLEHALLSDTSSDIDVIDALAGDELKLLPMFHGYELSCTASPTNDQSEVECNISSSNNASSGNFAISIPYHLRTSSNCSSKWHISRSVIVTHSSILSQAEKLSIPTTPEKGSASLDISISESNGNLSRLDDQDARDNEENALVNRLYTPPTFEQLSLSHCRGAHPTLLLAALRTPNSTTTQGNQPPLTSFRFLTNKPTFPPLPSPSPKAPTACLIPFSPIPPPVSCLCRTPIFPTDVLRTCASPSCSTKTYHHKCLTRSQKMSSSCGVWVCDTCRQLAGDLMLELKMKKSPVKKGEKEMSEGRNDGRDLVDVKMPFRDDEIADFVKKGGHGVKDPYGLATGPFL
ncbi:hypothetical protein B0J11DRAFT_578480 [Dendryphion nanum]|uniref:Zinc finger PHD-type domain-containing protein n=1 Tax=Dendryphion nanum TaxID=256645 RepID=A0A9P9DZF9_9PLEO|nr:hypothetical protein B0J11DRAFT_578480 [Dendryphion nanum]